MNPTEPDFRHFMMARTARSCSFIALITALFGTIVFPFILGGLSIILAVISKGSTAAYQLNAKIAIIVSCLTLLGNTFFVGVTFYNVICNPEYQQQLNEQFEQIYGMDINEYLNSLSY